MIKKGKRIYSIVKFKCPNCHEGDFFEGSAVKGLVKEKCDKCGMPYRKEPGFYQGSYYVVYGLGVAVFVATWVTTLLFFPNLGYTGTIIAIISALVLASPLMFPLSKIIWANFFYRYGKYPAKKSA